jgi:hypothetical protein
VIRVWCADRIATASLVVNGEESDGVRSISKVS